MKITRINRIRNHRIFRDFSWPAELSDFACFNVIYGWNGAGKTTLSNLFLHLQKKQPMFEGEIEFRFGQNNVSGTDLGSSILPCVKVFNREFVSAAHIPLSDQACTPVIEFNLALLGYWCGGCRRTFERLHVATRNKRHKRVAEVRVGQRAGAADVELLEELLYLQQRSLMIGEFLRVRRTNKLRLAHAAR